MRTRTIHRFAAWIAAAIAAVAIGAPVASAVPIDGNDTRLYQEWTSSESLRLLQARKGTRVKKRPAQKRAPIGSCPTGRRGLQIAFVPCPVRR